MQCHIGSEKWNQAAAYYVRMQVFVLERDILLKEEFDEQDHDKTCYVVIYDGKIPVATGRYIKSDALTVRPGRIAVLKEYRKKGLGERVMEELERMATEEECKVSIIHGEISAAAFYERLGYIRNSAVFFEDGVPCVELRKYLN